MRDPSWLEELEARLEQGLESFLRANPDQESLLSAQEALERCERLRRERRSLLERAEACRQGLLELAGEIRSWQERVRRARSAGANDLADRAETHVAALMERGRVRWQELTELGERSAAVERELAEAEAKRRHNATASTPSSASQAAQSAAGSGAGAGSDRTGSDLEADWAAFEAQEELRELRQRVTSSGPAAPG